MEPVELGSHEKELGSWYTGGQMAQILADWAIRDLSATAMDPSFGGGVFFAAAERRLLALGQDAAHIRNQLYGVDLDEGVFAVAAETPIVPPCDHLIHSDFFDVQPSDLPAVDCIIGNPPYVRYQQWDAKASPAHGIATDLGYPLTKLSSLWAPFVLQMSRFLKLGGRMALVLPAELLYAQYARPVQRFLNEQFATVKLALFETSVFEGAQEEVVLLFADGFCQGPGQISIRQFRDLEEFDIKILLGDSVLLQPAMPLFGLLSDGERAGYESFSELARPLSEIADLDIGIVTGANKFFIVPENVVEEKGLHRAGLVPVLTKAGDVAGASVSTGDWEDLVERGRPAHLISINKTTPDEILSTFSPYIEAGEEAGVNAGYKCRVRNPWWAVPMLPPPHLFLTYINGSFPRLAHNAAQTRSTNSIHNLRMIDDSVDPAAFVVAFYNAGTLLSAELCGRSYGGGALKLEPTEGGRLMIPSFSMQIGEHLSQVDQFVREGHIDKLLDLTDTLVLHPLGFSEEECGLLRSTWKKLQNRRTTRAKTTSK